MGNSNENGAHLRSPSSHTLNSVICSRSALNESPHAMLPKSCGNHTTRITPSGAFSHSQGQNAKNSNGARDGKIPLPLRPNALTDASSKLASRLRASRADIGNPSTEPEELLELHGYEASPHCRLVREVLTRYEIPYILHNIALGSPKRPMFVARTGRMQVPLLGDPIHCVSIFGSRAIIQYLEDHYAASAPAAA